MPTRARSLDEEILASQPGASFLQSSPWIFAAQLDHWVQGEFRIDGAKPLVGRYYDGFLVITGRMRSYLGLNGLEPEHVPGLTAHARSTRFGCFACIETERPLPTETVTALEAAGWRPRVGDRRAPSRTAALQQDDAALWADLGLPEDDGSSARLQALSWPLSSSAVAALEEIGRRAPHHVLSPLNRPRTDGLSGVWEAFGDAERMRVHSVNSPEGALLAGAITLVFGERAWLVHSYGPQRGDHGSGPALVRAVAAAMRAEGFASLTVPDLSAPRGAYEMPLVYDLRLGPGYPLWRFVNRLRERIARSGGGH